MAHGVAAGVPFGPPTTRVLPSQCGEFYAGLSVDEARAWEEFVLALAYWPISPEAAMQAGQDRYRFARQGTAITITDALLATVAREREAVLVTGNIKDYPMDDLQLFPLTGSER